jgi:ubiquinone/menaquinone biosynthesis C-methylase UbiE
VKIIQFEGQGVKLPFKDNSFDKVFSWSVFQYLSSKAEAESLLKEFYRIGKTGGLILISDIVFSKTKGQFLRPNATRNISIMLYLWHLIAHSIYLKFDPYEFKKFCEYNFGKTTILKQDSTLLWHRERVDILIEIAKK